MKKKNIHQTKTIEEKAAAYFKDQAALLEKHQLIARLVIAFPRQRRVPILGKIGMWLVSRSGGIIDTMIKEKITK